MSHILITGGTGFVGSHVCISLIERGYSLVVLDNETNSTSKSLIKIKEYFKDKILNIDKKLIFINVDLRDFEKLDEIFSNYNKVNSSIDCVIHLAGLKDMSKSF